MKMYISLEALEVYASLLFIIIIIILEYVQEDRRGGLRGS